MSPNATSSTNEDTTQQQELQRLLNELQASTAPLAKAIRMHLQGKPVDLSTVRSDVRLLIDGLIEQVSPTFKAQGPVSFTPADLASTYWERINEKRENAPTGIAGLNTALSGGLESDRLVVLLGAPGSGKTTLANQIADHVAGSKRPALYITSEDVPHTLLAKTIARYGQIEYNAVLRGYLSEREKIDAAMREYCEVTSAGFLRYVDATQGITLDDIYEQAQVHFKNLKSAASGAPLLVVDYLQRLSRHENLGADARQSATVYTERLRAIACDLHATVLVLSAMNRASGYHAGNSAIASAKESGDIDYTADVIMAIGEQEGTSEPAPGMRRWMLRIDKNRQGYTTYDEHHIYLDWYPARQQFTEAKADENMSTSSASNNGRSSRRAR